MELLLTADERQAAASELPQWSFSDTALERAVSASTFQAAIDWVIQIAAVAEEMDHHPDIDIRWRTLRLVATTHSAGGLTARDVALAKRIDEIVGS